MSITSGTVRVAAVACCVAVATPVRADVLDAGPTDRVALDVPNDVVITSLGIIGAAVPILFKNEIAPAQCRWLCS